MPAAGCQLPAASYQQEVRDQPYASCPLSHLGPCFGAVRACVLVGGSDCHDSPLWLACTGPSRSRSGRNHDPATRRRRPHSGRLPAMSPSKGKLGLSAGRRGGHVRDRGRVVVIVPAGGRSEDQHRHYDESEHLESSGKFLSSHAWGVLPTHRDAQTRNQPNRARSSFVSTEGPLCCPSRPMSRYPRTTLARSVAQCVGDC